MPDDFEGDDFDAPADIGDDGSADLAERWNGLASDQPAPEQHPGIEPPTSWPARAQELGGQACHPRIANLLRRREREAHAKITSQGQELARLRQLEPLSKWVEQFPADMPREEVFQHLEQAFGAG